MQHFKQAFNKTMKQDSMISYEVIAYQKDDGFSAKLDQIFADMGFKNSKQDTPSSATTEDFRKGAIRLSELIQDRTGMNLNVVNSSNGDMLTYPIVLDVSTSLFSTMLSESSMKELDKYNYDMSLDEFKSLDRYDKAVYFFARNLKEAVRDKRLQDLVVDLNKARVYNLPKDYIGIIFLDFRFMQNRGLTVREAAAIFLHEVGHNFTSIETSYRQILNSNIIVDSLIESVKTGKAVTTGIIKAYEKIYNEKVTKDMSFVDVFLHMIDVEKKRLKLGAELDMNYTIDSERVADLFAARMGYGEELVTALASFGPMIGNTFPYFKHATFGMLFAATTLAIIALVISNILIPMMAPVITIAVFILIGSLWGGEYDDNITLTYDGYYNRFLKVKLDLIRVIRTDDKIDPKYREKLLNGINTVDNILSKIPKPSEGLFLKIHKLFSNSKQRLFDMKRSEQLMEILQENDLWASSNKIKQYS